MKLNGKAMVAVAMILGSMAALTGCKSSEQSKADEAAPAAEPVATSEAPAAQTQTGEEHATIQASTKVVVGASTPAARPLPPMPAPRFENPGRAPSRDHVFVKGFWRIDEPRIGYVWVPGHWQAQHAPSAPPAPRFENPGRAPSGQHVYVPGYWRWTGHDYKSFAGHWDIKRNAPHIRRRALGEGQRPLPLRARPLDALSSRAHEPRRFACAARPGRPGRAVVLADNDLARIEEVRVRRRPAPWSGRVPGQYRGVDEQQGGGAPV